MRSGRQDAQANAGPVAVGPSAEPCRDVDQAPGDLFFIQIAGAGFQQALRQAVEAGFGGGNKRRACGKIDLHVEDGQHARLDEIHLRPGGSDPVLDLDPGQGQARCQGCQQTDQRETSS